MSAALPIERKYGRRRSGTADWHMSRRAVDLSLEQIYKRATKGTAPVPYANPAAR